MHPLSLTSSKTPPGRPFPELAPHTGLNSGLLAPEFNLRLSTVGVFPSPSVPQFPQWPTKDNLPPPPPGLSACHSEREGAGQTKLSPGRSTPHVASPEACGEHPPPNWKRPHVSNSMPAVQRASLEHEFGRPVGGCVGGSYRPQGTCHFITPGPVRTHTEGLTEGIPT